MLAYLLCIFVFHRLEQKVKLSQDGNCVRPHLYHTVHMFRCILIAVADVGGGGGGGGPCVVNREGIPDCHQCWCVSEWLSWVPSVCS